MDTTTATQSITEPPTKAESVEAKNTPSPEGQVVSKSKPRSRVIRSRSKKSESDSKTSQSQESRQDRPKTFRRYRILNRPFYVREFAEDDIKWAYADYRKRNNVEIEPSQFKEEYLHALRHVQQAWTIVKAENKDRVVGFIFQTGNGYSWETHAQWMEWASPRDILAGAMRFWDKMRYMQNILLVIPEEIDRFAEQLRRYGALQRVGKIRKYYPDKRDAFLWQSREK